MSGQPLSQRLEQLALIDPSGARRLSSLATTAPLDDDWQILREHQLIDGRWLSKENVRVLYVHLTDSLIHRLSTGFDRLICLDKSARPVGWFVTTMWDILAPTFGDRGGTPIPLEVTPRPKVTFLNIDRLQWRDVIDPQGVGAFDVSAVPTRAVEGLRRSFLYRVDENLQGSSLMRTKTHLSGERVLVVDEVSVSGDTAAIAVGILQRAFPDTYFEAGHWMRPSLIRGRDGNMRNNTLPVWYRSDTNLGRGIGDRDPEASLGSLNPRVRQAAWFLSRPHQPAATDVLGRRLRNEIRQVAMRVLTGQDALVPAFERDPDEADSRSRFYSEMSLQELRQWREDTGIILNV